MQLQDENRVAHAPRVLCPAPSPGSGQRRPATHRPVHRRETGIFGGGAENNTRGACATQSPTASFAALDDRLFLEALRALSARGGFGDVAADGGFALGRGALHEWLEKLGR